MFAPSGCTAWTDLVSAHLNAKNLHKITRNHGSNKCFFKKKKDKTSITQNLNSLKPLYTAHSMQDCCISDMPHCIKRQQFHIMTELVIILVFKRSKQKLVARLKNNQKHLEIVEETVRFVSYFPVSGKVLHVHLMLMFHRTNMDPSCQTQSPIKQHALHNTSKLFMFSYNGI